MDCLKDMKAKIFILLQVAVLVLFSACERNEHIRGKGSIESQFRNESEFNSIHLKHSGDVEVYSDSVFSIEIYDYENLLPYIRTYVSGRTLYIDAEHHYQLHNSKLRVIIHMPDLHETRISGSGDIQILEPFYHFRNADISGSGKIEGHSIYTDQPLSLRISGSGKMIFTGETPYLDANISGSGKISAFNLEAKNVYAKISGSGRIETTATEELDATISGSGSVIYDGNARVSSHISGSGSVRHR